MNLDKRDVARPHLNTLQQAAFDEVYIKLRQEEGTISVDDKYSGFYIGRFVEGLLTLFYFSVEPNNENGVAFYPGKTIFEVPNVDDELTFRGPYMDHVKLTKVEEIISAVNKHESVVSGFIKHNAIYPEFTHWDMDVSLALGVRFKLEHPLIAEFKERWDEEDEDVYIEGKLIYLSQPSKEVDVGYFNHDEGVLSDVDIERIVNLTATLGLEKRSTMEIIETVSEYNTSTKDRFTFTDLEEDANYTKFTMVDQTRISGYGIGSYTFNSDNLPYELDRFFGDYMRRALDSESRIRTNNIFNTIEQTAIANGFDCFVDKTMMIRHTSIRMVSPIEVIVQPYGVNDSLVQLRFLNETILRREISHVELESKVKELFEELYFFLRHVERPFSYTKGLEVNLNISQEGSPIKRTLSIYPTFNNTLDFGINNEFVEVWWNVKLTTEDTLRGVRGELTKAVKAEGMFTTFVSAISGLVDECVFEDFDAEFDRVMNHLKFLTEITPVIDRFRIQSPMTSEDAEKLLDVFTPVISLLDKKTNNEWFIVGGIRPNNDTWFALTDQADRVINLGDFDLSNQTIDSVVVVLKDLFAQCSSEDDIEIILSKLEGN